MDNVFFMELTFSLVLFCTIKLCIFFFLKTNQTFSCWDDTVNHYWTQCFYSALQWSTGGKSAFTSDHLTDKWVKCKQEMQQRALLITGGMFWPKSFISHSLYKVHLHPEPLLISDPSVSTVTDTMGARKVTQMNLLLLFKSSSSVHITVCVTAVWNLSQPLCGILTFVHKEILDSWAKSAGEALYKIMWFLWRQGRLLAIEFFSNERYLSGAGVWNRPSLTLVRGH